MNFVSETVRAASPRNYRECDRLLEALRLNDSEFIMETLIREDGQEVVIFTAPGGWGFDDLLVSLEPDHSRRGWRVWDPVTLYVFGRARTLTGAVTRAVRCVMLHQTV